jgi:hypothetical protein
MEQAPFKYHNLRSGANNEDQNNIRRLNAEGLTAEEISIQLGIVESCVQSFCDMYNGKTQEEVAETAPPPAPPATAKSKGKGK